MNNKKYLLLTASVAVSALYSSSAWGQNMIDGVRFGSSDIIGTARYRSMAGAFGALGGDLSCMGDNPAGLAIYRGTNVISITPHLGFTSTETLGAVKATGKDNNFSVSNFGALLSFKPENDYLVNFNIGFSIERKAQTFRKMNAEIDYPSGSFGEYLFEQGNSFLEDYNLPASYLGTNTAWNDNNCPILTLMGYESFALDTDPHDDHHVSNPIYDNTYQGMNLRERTRHDNYNISGSFNFSDVLYAGVTVRITDFNSTIEHCFTEVDDKAMLYDPYVPGNYINYDNRIETKGSGIGINLGVLWKPTEAWRIGAAVHTPVWMDMKNFNDALMQADNIFYQQALAEDQNLLNESNWNDEIEFDYSTPWEYQFSTAYVIGTSAIISLEYDMTDFKTMKFHEPEYSGFEEKRYYDDMNATQKKYLQAQHTIKAGAEYRITPQFSLRAGYAYKSSPYKKDALFTTVHPDDISFLYRTATKPNYSTLDDQHYITGGLGWRCKNWTIDLSVMSHSIKEYYSAYPCDYSDSDILDFNTHSLNWDLTFGYRF